MEKWLFLATAAVLNAMANILLKIGSKTAAPLAEDASFLAKVFNFLNVATIAGIGLFAANVLFYRRALDSLNVSIAYPLMVSSALVIVTLAAVLLPVLSEKLSGVQVAGMVLIAAGIWLVAR